jgi:hypothetical protein
MVALQKGTISRALNTQLPPELIADLSAGPVAREQGLGD